ncbi:class I SAM-dependent methyltransferase [Listeria costaricensis]|uniref:class I SAM-dependent methyltransferase n=1 Tax=Listeria costaricensis TaxID=2026604 RepID=UPI0013C4F2A4|nr:class I SAM-dependent methyltransferase [Listeria costaricensis]
MTHPYPTAIRAFSRQYHYNDSTSPLLTCEEAAANLTDAEIAALSARIEDALAFFDPDMNQLLTDPAKKRRYVLNRYFVPQTVAFSCYIKEQMRLAVQRGTYQFVSVGSGLESFVPLLPAHDEVRFFDLDNHNMLLQKYTTNTAAMHTLSIDYFTDISEALSQNGFHSDRPAFFLLPGHAMYMEKLDFLKLLQQLGQVAHPGSSVVFDYVDEASFLMDADETIQKILFLSKSNRAEIVAGYDPLFMDFFLENTAFIYENLSSENINQLYFENQSSDLATLPYFYFAHAALK